MTDSTEKRTYRVTMADGETKTLVIPVSWIWTLGPVQPSRKKARMRDRGQITSGWMLRVYGNNKSDPRAAIPEVLSIHEVSEYFVLRDEWGADESNMAIDEEVDR